MFWCLAHALSTRTHVGVLDLGDLPSSDESCNFVLLPSLYRGGITRGEVEVVA